MKKWFLPLGIIALCGVLSAADISTSKRPVADEYQGVKVTEVYRWFEKADDPEVQKWAEAQNTLPPSFLGTDSLRPILRNRIQGVYQKISHPFSGIQFRRGFYFDLKFQPPKDQLMLVSSKSTENPASETVTIDPNEKHEKGLLTIDGLLIGTRLSKIINQSADYMKVSWKSLEGDLDD